MNEGGGDADVLALPPRVMELQVDMEARVDGEGKATIIPSGEVKRRLVGLLSSKGASEEGLHALKQLLQGGQEYDLGESPDEALVDEAKNGVRNSDLDEEYRGFFEEILDAAEEGKYIPFVALPSPLESGGFVSLEFQRVRGVEQSPWSRVLGRFVGVFQSRQRFTIGRRHSTHLRVSAPAGTTIRRCKRPSHWPADAGKTRSTPESWRLYLSFRDKLGIWNQRDAEEVGPADEEWKASCSFQIPIAIDAVFLFLFTLLALGPRFLAATCSGQPCLPIGELLNLYVLAGGILVPVFLAESRNSLPFRYVGWHTALLAGLAGGWFLIATVNPVAWDVTLIGLALATKEAALSTYRVTAELFS